jgi:predicted nucleic acid-binding protein
MSATGADRAFWDASAVVLLCVHQRSSAAARRIRTARSSMATWWCTPIEVRSALERLRREGRLDASPLAASVRRLEAITEAALEVAPSESVRGLAASMLGRHELRGADALQLAAALVLCRERPRGRGFVCFDERLKTAADAAGFVVLP